MSAATGEIITEGLLELPEGAGTLWLRDSIEAAPGERNLSLMDSRGERKWDAAEVHALDKWVIVRVEDGRILANSWEGYLCELNPADGAIISCTFVK